MILGQRPGFSRARNIGIFCIGGVIALSACATTAAPEPIATEEIDLPGWNSPQEDQASQPQLSYLGGLNAYLTLTQTPFRADFSGSQSEAETSLAAAIKAQTETTGKFYRQMVVTVDDASDFAIDGRTNQEVKYLSCDDTKGNAFGKFLGSLLGYKETTAAALTVTVSQSFGAKEPRYFVKDFPLLSVERNKKDKDQKNSKKGKTCDYFLFTGALTPYISPQAGDKVDISFNLLRATERDISLGGILGFVKNVSSLLMKTPNDGVVGGITDIMESKVLDSINELMANFDKRTKLSRVISMPLGLDPNSPYDKFVISLGAPTKIQQTDSVETIEFPKNAVTLQLNYRPSVMADCEYQEIARCGGSFEEPQKVLDFRVEGKTLEDSAGKADAGKDNLGKILSTAAKTSLGEKPSDAVGSESLADVCDSIRNGNRFPPIGAFNRVDGLIVMYSLLAAYTEYKDEIRLDSEKCLDRKEKKLLADLGPEKTEYVNPTYTFPEARRTAADYAKEFADSRDNLSEVFADNVVLDILTPVLIPADSATSAGGAFRGVQAVTQQIGAEASRLDLIGQAFCATDGYDSALRRPTTKNFGFWMRLRDTGAPDAPAYSVPILIERDDNGSGVFSVKRMTIADPEEYFRAVYGDPKTRPALSGVVEHLDGKHCMTTPEKAALEAFIAKSNSTVEENENTTSGGEAATPGDEASDAASESAAPGEDAAEQ